MATQIETGTTVSTQMMSYHPEEKRFSGFASDVLGALRDYPRIIRRIYPDACDEGIRVRSHVTGKVAWFVYVGNVDLTPDGDNYEMVFEPTPEAVRANPALRGTKITLLND